MSLADAFAPYESRWRAEVLAATFGHLYPKPGINYKGEILFAWTAYGHEHVIVNAKFEGLDGSPELMEDMLDFISENTPEEGIVYRWRGTYRKFKNGRCRFSGKIMPHASI